MVEPTEDKKQDLNKEIADIEKKVDDSTSISPLEQITAQMDKLDLTADQRRTMKKILDNEEDGDIKHRIKKALITLKTQQNIPRQTQKKLDHLTPLYDSHDFWDSQPVPKAYEIVNEDTLDKPIDLEKTPADVKQEPYNLPQGFHWANVDIMNQEEAKEVYTLLTQHYVEDDDAMFRFDYQIPFLQWALTPPGYNRDWLFGVRGGKNNALFGFISGIPVDMNVRGKKIKMAEINFLCVHKKLRTKRLAPVLILEVTRRVNMTNVWQAVYTAGIVIPKPFAKTTYWHRSLNPKKLIDVGFSSLPAKQTMARYQKLLKLPSEPTIEGVRPMEYKDIPIVHAMLTEYLKKFDTHFEFSQDELIHFILPRDDVIEAWVIENNGEIQDFFSFYSLPSTILKHVEEKLLRVAYAYYTVAKTHSLQDVMKQALIIAKKKGYDVYNALDIMDNKQFLEEHNFGVGDGNLHYYFYNWRVPDIQADGVSMVLV
jgi:glycylpeptide N-tetradecanoyltransferase